MSFMYSTTALHLHLRVPRHMSRSLKSNSNMTVENYCVKSWNSNTRHIIRAFHQSRIIQVTDKSIDWQREFQRQREKQLAEKRRGNWEKLSATQKAAHAAKTMTYTAIIIGGVVVFGGLLYLIGSELFSSSSVNSVYSTALEKVRQYPKVQEIIGTPIAGHHEKGGSRARSRRVNHKIIEGMDTRKMILKFYVEGPKGEGNVHVEMIMPVGGKSWETNLIYVNIGDTHMVVEDNRPTNHGIRKRTKWFGF